MSGVDLIQTLNLICLSLIIIIQLVILFKYILRSNTLFLLAPPTSLSLSVCLDPLSCCVSRLRFSFFFFFLLGDAKSLLFITVMNSNRKRCICALFMDPQITLFNNFFIKNGSHGTIYAFKNYFVTVFSVFSFQFQQDKFYPNRPKCAENMIC